MQTTTIPSTRLHKVLLAGGIRNAPEANSLEKQRRRELMELTAKLASAKRDLASCHSGWADIERTIAQLRIQVEECKKPPELQRGRFRVSNNETICLVPR